MGRRHLCKNHQLPSWVLETSGAATCPTVCVCVCALLELCLWGVELWLVAPVKGHHFQSYSPESAFHYHCVDLIQRKDVMKPFPLGKSLNLSSHILLVCILPNDYTTLSLYIRQYFRKHTYFPAFFPLPKDPIPHKEANLDSTTSRNQAFLTPSTIITDLDTRLSCRYQMPGCRCPAVIPEVRRCPGIDFPAACPNSLLVDFHSLFHPCLSSSQITEFVTFWSSIQPGAPIAAVGCNISTSSLCVWLLDIGHYLEWDNQALWP